MSLKRTTFSESWYRIADLSPRLHPCLHTSRQHYRGEMWYVLEDPVNNHYYRISEAAYQFLALLDGQRPVASVWNICNERFGDEAPTQGEVIQLLGQLHSSNLLLGDMPVDTAALLKRYKQRKQREITGKLRGILFMKIPLWDPNTFLKIFNPICGLLFTPLGMLVWIILACTGIVYTLSGAENLGNQNSGILSASNLPWLYACFVLIKVLHELGHGFACKRFGVKSGTGGPVHTMGIMLMLLTPVPYIDCSSAWSLRSKWQRMMIGGAGMLVELMVAAVAVIIWARTSEGSLAHSLSYNVMFVTSVSTILFNGNPLLRYDAYYMLSDILEIPNMASSSNNYFFYLCKKYIFGIRDSFHSAEGVRQKAWLLVYSISAYIYRLFIFVSIYLFLADQLFIFGVLFGAGGIYRLVVKPIWDFCRYLISNPELMRNRPRALSISGLVTSTLVVFLFGVPIADRVRVEGVVEPQDIHMVFALSDGFLESVHPSGQSSNSQSVLVRSSNPVLVNELTKQTIQLRELRYRFKLAQTRNTVESQVLKKQISTLEESRRKQQEKIGRLIVSAPQEGVWFHDDLHKLKDSFIQKGTELGMVVGTEKMIIRAIAPQEDAQLLDEAAAEIQFRVKGRPETVFSANILRKFPAGLQKLPSAALGYAVGGEVQTSMDDKEGTKTAEKVFEIHLQPTEEADSKLFPGQVVVLRFVLPKKTVVAQTVRYLRQTFQKRFKLI